MGSHFPLAGIRVVDLSQYVPGPYATRLLCDLGAEVIKVEAPTGDPLRRMFTADMTADSPVYRLLNRGKTIARLNLKDKSVLNRVLRIIEGADVLLESFRPGVVERLGLGSGLCRERFPGLVYCSLSGYGQDGPLRLAGGHDVNYCAAAGMYSHHAPEAPPFPLVADHTGAMNAVNAILAALVGRTRSGQGAVLDVSLYEAMLSWQYSAHATMQQPDNNELALLTGGAACYNIYRTADKRVLSLGALERPFWKNFCDAMGHPEWIERQDDPLPQTVLIDEVRTLVGAHTLDAIVDRLEGIDCCFEPVPTVAEIYRQAQSVDRGLFALDRFSYPGKIDGRAPASEAPTRDLPAEEIPAWNP